MKILIIANYRESAGGISGQVKLLYEHLKRVGEEVKVFSTKGNPMMRLWLFLKLFVVASRYNVLHIHACSYWGFLPAIYGIIVGRLLHKHLVLTYHGGDGGVFLGLSQNGTILPYKNREKHCSLRLFGRSFQAAQVALCHYSQYP